MTHIDNLAEALGISEPALDALMGAGIFNGAFQGESIELGIARRIFNGYTANQSIDPSASIKEEIEQVKKQVAAGTCKPSVGTTKILGLKRDLEAVENSKANALQPTKADARATLKEAEAAYEAAKQDKSLRGPANLMRAKRAVQDATVAIKNLDPPKESFEGTWRKEFQQKLLDLRNSFTAGTLDMFSYRDGCEKARKDFDDLVELERQSFKE